MNQCILDTDQLSLFQRGHEVVVPRVLSYPTGSVVITVVSVEEQVRGRLAYISRAKKTPELLKAYWWLRHSIIELNRFPILEFDEAAQLQFERLKSLKIRVGTPDLRIAAIALATDSVLVTRNRQDFDAIPSLTLADWSQPPL